MTGFCRTGVGLQASYAHADEGPAGDIATVIYASTVKQLFTKNTLDKCASRVSCAYSYRQQHLCQGDCRHGDRLLGTSYGSSR